MTIKPKIYGYPLPSVVEDGSCVSVTLSFPNILEYRAAFNGSINMLGKWFQWAHTQADYQNIPSFNQAVATLWVGVLASAVWTEDCMTFCEQMIACINSNAATRAAIVNALKEDPEFNQWFKENVYRLTEGQIGGKLVAGDCDESVVAGRAMAVVNRLATNAEDFLEVLEVGTNDEERIADILEAIPVLGEAPVGDVINFLQDLLEDFGENFSAANTTGRREELARLVWCKMLKDPDCSITFEALYEVLQQRALSGLDIASAAQDIVEFITDGDFNTDDAVFYGLLAAEVGFVLNSRDFYGVNIGNLGVIMKDAEPSSIWETWDPCTPETCDGDDLITSADGWEPLDGPDYSIWHDGEGYGPGTTTPQRIGVKKAYGTLISRITVTFNMPTTGTMDVGTFTYGYPPAFGSIVHGAPTTTWELEFTASTTGIAIDYRVGVLDPIPSDLRIICIKVE